MATTENIQLVNLGELTFSVVRNHYQNYWHALETFSWEPGTLRSIKHFVRPGWKFFDIGSWIGPTALPAAALGAEVFCFEPDPLAYERLCANVTLNPGFSDRIKLFSQAVGLSNGEITLYVDALGNSETSIYRVRERENGTIDASEMVQAEVIDFRAFFAEASEKGRPQFLKFDIEGAEFDLIPAIAEEILLNQQTVIHLSTHARNIADPSARRSMKEKVLKPFLDLAWVKCDEDGLHPIDAMSCFEEELAHPDREGTHLFMNYK